MTLTDDELALRRAFAEVIAAAASPHRTTTETLDHAVAGGRRRRVVRRTTSVAGTVAALAVVVGFSWSLLPASAPHAGWGDAPAASTTGPTTPVPTPIATSEPYGSSGVPNAAWPSNAWLEAVASRVAGAGGGTVLSTTSGVDYYEPPESYDAMRRPLWAVGSHLRSRSVELAVSTLKGDYLVDVTVDGNNPTGPDGEANQAYFAPSFDMSKDTPGTATLVSERDRKVFSYANKAFPERKTLQAMVWQQDSLLLTVAVTNYGVETPGAKKPVGPSWSQLGLTPQDLLDAVR